MAFNIIPELQKFVDQVKNFQVPDKFPDRSLLRQHYSIMSVDEFSVRHEVTTRSMYAIVDMNWTKDFVEVLDLKNKSILEIMCGRGWLAEALRLHGCQMINATDDRSWQKPAKDGKQHEVGQDVYKNIETLSAYDSVKKYRDVSDILICSWPYMDSYFANALLNWDPAKPIIYIGESYGGCTANDDFFEMVEMEDLAGVNMPQWDGMHDYVMTCKLKKDAIISINSEGVLNEGI